MNKKLTIIILSALSIGIVAILVFNSAEDYSRKIKFNQERVFAKNLSLKKTFNIDKNLALMKIFDGDLFFVSWGEGVLFKHDTVNGKLISTLGKKGEGPNENLLITDYEIQDSSYFTVDDRKFTIQQVSFNDSLIYFHKHPKPIRRSIKADSNYLFVDWDADFNMSFEKFNIKSKETSLIEVQDEKLSITQFSGLIYDGFLVKNDKYIVYVSYSNDKFICFDKNLEYNYSMDMIYDVPDPIWERLSNGKLYPNPNNLSPNESAYIDNKNNLYILSQKTDQSHSDIRMIDVYNLDTQTYVYSIKTEEVDGHYPDELIVLDDNIYFLYPTKIAVFKTNNLNI